MTGWHAADDLDTEYRQTSGGCGGSGTDFWMDLEVQIKPGLPASATRLTLTGPNGAEVNLGLAASS